MARLRRIPQESNDRSASTRFVWQNDRISAARPEGKARQAKPVRFRGLSRRNPRDKLTLTITYKGGAEGWWLVEARGRSGVFPAAAVLHDVMREVLQIHEHQIGHREPQ